MNRSCWWRGDVARHFIHDAVQCVNISRRLPSSAWQQRLEQLYSSVLIMATAFDAVHGSAATGEAATTTTGLTAGGDDHAGAAGCDDTQASIPIAPRVTADGDLQKLRSFVNATASEFAFNFGLSVDALCAALDAVSRADVTPVESLETSDSSASGLLLLSILIDVIEANLAGPAERLASYGTLRPGEENYHIVSHIAGEWVSGIVHGHVDTKGRYPVFTWKLDGAPIPVQVLCSPQLPTEYQAIDEFEGEAYQRTLVPVAVGAEWLYCNVYEGA